MQAAEPHAAGNLHLKGHGPLAGPQGHGRQEQNRKRLKEIPRAGFGQRFWGGPRAAKKNLSGGLAALGCNGTKTIFAPSAAEAKTSAGDAVPT